MLIDVQCSRNSVRSSVTAAASTLAHTTIIFDGTLNLTISVIIITLARLNDCAATFYINVTFPILYLIVIFNCEFE